MGNLWRSHARAEREDARILTAMSLRAFDEIFLEWTNHRGLGHMGRIIDSHLINPCWENGLIRACLTARDPKILLAPVCYRECGFECPNNQRAHDQLYRFAKKYASIKNRWEHLYKKHPQPVNNYCPISLIFYILEYSISDPFRYFWRNFRALLALRHFRAHPLGESQQDHPHWYRM